MHFRTEKIVFLGHSREHEHGAGVKNMPAAGPHAFGGQNLGGRTSETQKPGWLEKGKNSIGTILKLSID